MKRKISSILFGLLFLIGFGVLVYPTVANQWNTYRQSRLISHYETVVEEMKPEDFTAEWEKAYAFNDTMTQNNIYGDVFGSEEEDLEDTEYWKVLNVANDGVMGYLSIPKINVKLAIYHGVDDEVLQTGIGHLDGTKLPIGGESTHSVLTGHRGLPDAKLFTDMDKVQKKDQFYIHVLDEVLAYEVDQIKVVDPEDTSDLDIVEGKDYVTLVTCTPYAVNTHRLLVRGHRVPYTGEEKAKTVSQIRPAAMAKRVVDVWPWFLFMMAGVAVTEGVIILLILIKRHHDKKKKG